MTDAKARVYTPKASNLLVAFVFFLQVILKRFGMSVNVCKKDGCYKAASGRGYCANHYQKLKLRGDFTDEICSVDGCSKPLYSGSMCSRHRKQILTHGKISGNRSVTTRDRNIIVPSNGHAIMVLRNRNGDDVADAIIDLHLVGDIVKHRWHLTTRGYVESRIGGKLKKLHQFVSGFPYCDHKDRDRLNNLESNIRHADNAKNSRNKSSTGGLSKYKGVWLCKTTRRWCAAIRYEGNRMWLGRHDTEHEAALAYNKAAESYNDEFLYINKVVI